MLKTGPEELLSKIAHGDRVALSRAITLIESTSSSRAKEMEELLIALPPLRPSSICLAISGSPGAGKSTFIEKLGLHLLDRDLKIAVLTVDPSSQRTGGSILGDQTRMETLSKRKEVFIRQSPASENLGGIGRHTRETVLLCEHAGYDVIIIETVGVGQSEYAAFHLSDLFVLLVLPGSGDDLQGIKRGIVEMADQILISKADGDALSLAKNSRRYFANALHLLKGHSSNAKVALVSSKTGLGIEDFWESVAEIISQRQGSGEYSERRLEQRKYWLKQIIQDQWLNLLKDDPLYQNLDFEQLLSSEENLYQVSQRFIQNILED